MATTRSKRPARKPLVAPIRVLLVDDHPLWRDTLRKVLERNRFAKVVAEAGDGVQAAACAEGLDVDVVVMDIQMPAKSGIEATRDLLHAKPSLRVLVLASSDSRDQVLEAVSAGASGYLLKTARSDEVREAVRRVREGEMVFPPRLADVVLGALRDRGPALPRADGDRPANSIRREGDYWTIAFDGDVVRIKDTRGVRYLEQLLRNPGREIHSLELVAGMASAEQRALRADAGPLLDATAKAAYRRKLADLEEDLREAEEFGDPERASAVRQEMDALIEQLAAAVGLGGRDRRAASAAERARVNVTLALKSTLSKIEKHAAPLAEHLTRTVKTGVYCSYSPDPRAPINWE